MTSAGGGVGPGGRSDPATGSVQPHGALLAFDDDGGLRLASANAAELLGTGLRWGQQLSAAVGPAAATELTRMDAATWQPIAVQAPGGRLDAVAHRTGELTLVELERPAGDEATAPSPLRGLIRRLTAARSVAELCEVAATELRRLSGFDRVMVYRFDGEDTAQIVAEDRGPGIESLAGQQAPRTEVPHAGRALSVLGWVQSVADVAAEPVPLVGDDRRGPVAVDLTQVQLRSASPADIAHLRRLGVSAAMSVSLIDEDRLWGLLTCHHHAGPRLAPWQTRAAAEVLGRLVSVLLRATAQAEHTAEVARVQQSLLKGLVPARVKVAGDLEIESHYRAGGMGDVGGDWFDVLELPDAGVAVVVGDVAGHGIGAASTMAQLRHGIRAFLLDDRDPASVLARMNRLTQWTLPDEVATVVVAMHDADRGVLRVSSAGHPPPLLLEGGSGRFLELEAGPALGLSAAAGYRTTTQPFPDDAVLLLYTDGLVERRGEPLDAGLERLLLAALAHGTRQGLCDRLVAEVASPAADDDLTVVSISGP